MTWREAMLVIAGIFVLASYVLATVAFERRCGPHQVAVVGLRGPECVARGDG